MTWLPWLRDHRAELMKFGVIGGIAFVVDLGLYNLLLFGLDTPLSHQEKVVTSKVLSALAATLVAWVGNRLWTFRSHRTHRPARELLAFAVVNAVALAIGVVPVAVGRYLLDARGALALNVAAVVGIGLGTVARYVGYKKFVFTGAHAGASAPSPSPSGG